MHARMQSRCSHVLLCATLWTAAHQAPLSMGFSRQEYWSGLPFPSPVSCPSKELKGQRTVTPQTAKIYWACCKQYIPQAYERTNTRPALEWPSPILASLFYPLFPPLGRFLGPDWLCPMQIEKLHCSWGLIGYMQDQSEKTVCFPIRGF